MVSEINYNPDVVTCLANLSNDEVFTPPNLANKVLDLLPNDVWTSLELKFLDPVCKSGVFLREITKRLMIGLEIKIPDRSKRLNHILKNQVFGYATTELTALISRRTLYCSKLANGKYSIVDGFENEQGNLAYIPMQHAWKNGNCIFCNASNKVFDRSNEYESYAYSFIHENNMEVNNMKFDVIVGNPPYQLDDGGHGASAAPIYHKFVQQAINLNPRFLSMIIPSRWFTGGRVGDLYEFREQMLSDERIRELHDFVNARDIFPGVEIKGGVNYFLWDRDNPGLCKVVFHDSKNKETVANRRLLDSGMDTFIRDNIAVPIFQKVKEFDDDSFDCLVSANDPFGFDIRQKNSMKRVKPNYKLQNFEGAIPFYYNGWKQKGLGYFLKSDIRRNKDLLPKKKIFVPKAIGTGDTRSDIIKPFIPQQDACCSETYIVIGPFETEREINNVLNYIKTKFFHFIVGLKKNTQETRRNVYSLVPLQDFTSKWTDERLYKKYGLTEHEIDYIESLVPDME